MPITGEVNLAAIGDIKGSPDSETVDITAPSANIGSLNGDVGTEDDPLRTMLDQVSAYGENVYLENLKYLTVDGDITGNGDPDRDDIIGGGVTIETGGSVTDKGQGDAIIADNLDIDAGTVGEENNPMNMHVSGDVNIHSEYGKIHYLNGYSVTWDIQVIPVITLIHEPTGIRVTGFWWMKWATALGEACSNIFYHLIPNGEKFSLLSIIFIHIQ